MKQSTKDLRARIVEIQQAFKQALGQWTGCHWTTEWGECKIDLAGLIAEEANERAERFTDVSAGAQHTDAELQQLRRAWRYLTGSTAISDFPRRETAAKLARDYEQAVEWLTTVESDAEKAEMAAWQALAHVMVWWTKLDVKLSKLSEACRLAEEAACAEAKYGIDPTWGTFRDLVCALHTSSTGAAATLDLAEGRAPHVSTAEPRNDTMKMKHSSTLESHGGPRFTRLVMPACALLAVSLPTPAVGQILPVPDSYVLVDQLDQPLGLLVALPLVFPLPLSTYSAVIAIPFGDGTWSALVGMQNHRLRDAGGDGLLFEIAECRGPLSMADPLVEQALPAGLVYGVVLGETNAMVPDMMQPTRTIIVRRRFARDACREVNPPELRTVRPAVSIWDNYTETRPPFRLVPRWSVSPQE